MAAPVEQVGEIGRCPKCGNEVLLKTTIPLLADDGTGKVHVCVTCARALVQIPAVTPADP